MKEKKSLKDSHPDLALEADGWGPENFTFGSDKSQSWKCENGPSPKKSRKKAAKVKPGDAAPTLTKNTVKKAATKKKAAKKATGKAKKA